MPCTVGWPPLGLWERTLGIIGLKASQLAAYGSLLAYHVGVYYLLGFYGSACLGVGSFACLLAPIFFFEPGLESHYALCTLDILRGFTTSGVLGVLLEELGLCRESVSLLSVTSAPCLRMQYLNQSIN